MLSKEQVVKFHALISLIDMMQDSPFSDHFLNEEWVKDQIDRIFANKDLEK
jgi:hypothetical protein